MAEKSTKLYLRHRSGDYDLILKRGCSKNLHQFTDLVHRRVLVVTGGSVPAAYTQPLLEKCARGTLCTLPAGAKGRGMVGVACVFSALAENGFAKGDLIVGLGGNSALGVAGFAAGTYLGGIEFVAVPASVCAQLCACGGSMLGVNLDKPGFRAGVYRSPALALVDADLTEGQPAEARRDGLAWAMQMALTGDPALFALLEAETLDYDAVLWRVLNDKKELMDRYADGEAPVLDFGGPVARALWQVYGCHGRRTRGMQPGECLVRAMLTMTADKALAKRIRAICRREGLPNRATWNKEKVLAALLTDPAWVGNVLPVITVTGLGCWEQENLTADALTKRI